MFAIFQLSGKQYKVGVGSFLKLPKQDKKKNDVIIFDEVLFVKNEKGELIVGSPRVKNASVKGQVIEQIKDKKIIVFKKKRRHNYRRKLGHRQELTLIKITSIEMKKISNPSTTSKEIKDVKAENKKTEDVSGS